MSTEASWPPADRNELAGTEPPPLLFSIRADAMRTGDLRATVDPGCLRAFDGYVGGALALGYRPIELVRPEIYPATADRRGLFGSDRPIHVIFKRPEEIRILKGACNIGWVAPDAPRIRSEVVDDRPFSNHLRMLGLLDEIWAPSTVAADLLSRAGLGNVRVVPAPPPPSAPAEAVATAGIAWFAGGSATYPRFGASLPERGSGPRTVFGAAFDDDVDGRGDASALLDGYLALGADPPSVLLVSATSDEAFERLRACVVARQIAAGPAASTEAGLVGIVPSGPGGQGRGGFASAVDFVACASRFESDGRPMLEAMLRGCIPVTVRHSALADLIEPDSPLVIASAPDGEGWHRTDRASCTRALRAAASLGAADRAALAARSAQAARARMPAAALADRLRTLMAARHG